MFGTKDVRNMPALLISVGVSWNVFLHPSCEWQTIFRPPFHFVCLVSESCPLEVTSDNTGNYTWPKTGRTQTVLLNCSSPPSSVAKRSCFVSATSGAAWSLADTDECDVLDASSISGQLSALSKVRYIAVQRQHSWTWPTLVFLYFANPRSRMVSWYRQSPSQSPDKVHKKNGSR